MPSALPPSFGDALGHAPADKRIDILRAIAATGSISQAAREVAVSYKAAWQALETLTNLAGVPLVERAVGGAGGGGAVVTAQGLRLLDLADALAEARRDVQARWAGAESVQQADSALGRLALRTSMRNQLPALIETLDASGHIVRVVMRLGEAGCMAARITRESAELLGLREGMPVVALCKATAVRVAPVERDCPAADNVLGGRVASAARGASGDEIVVALAGALQLVGFAPAGSRLRTRQAVQVEVTEASVVVALGSA